jgi:hypothetical protein
MEQRDVEPEAAARPEGSRQHLGAEPADDGLGIGHLEERPLDRGLEAARRPDAQLERGPA